MSTSITLPAVVARIAAMLLFYGVLLFGAAGTLRWPAAWLFLLIHLCGSGTLAAWLWRHNPDLLRERMAFTKRPVKGWDRLIVRASAVLFVALFVLAGLDAVRYGWSRVPTGLQALALLGLAPAFAVFFSVMRANPYLLRTVEIHPEQGQRVVTSGPYSVVRHPMYVGAIWLCLCIPPALGSLWALAPAAGIAGLICARTAFEDRALHAELPGYVEYAQRTRYRLIPRVW